MLSDDEITAAAEAHVRTWYGDDWRPSAFVPLSDPDGVFFRCERHDGQEYTGMPTPFFISRETGRVVNLGDVPDLTQAEMKAVTDNPSTFHRIVVARWIRSSPDSGVHWHGAAARQDDTGRRFWGLVTTGPLTLLTLAHLFAAWRSAGAVRGWWLVAAVTALADRLFTFSYFIPTTVRLMRSH